MTMNPVVLWNFRAGTIPDALISGLGRIVWYKTGRAPGAALRPTQTGACGPLQGQFSFPV